MLNVLTLQLQTLKAETYKLLSSTPPKVKASESEIKALHKRYSKGLNLLKKITTQFKDHKFFLNKRYKTYSESLEKNIRD